jgi:uncharacterized membrane protein
VKKVCYSKFIRLKWLRKVCQRDKKDQGRISLLKERKLDGDMLQEKQKTKRISFQAWKSKKFYRHLRSDKAYWYWMILIFASITAMIVLAIPENFFPFVYLRYFLGAIFVLYLPGYVFIKALSMEQEFNEVERLVLSIGISLALIPIIGLLLNYTPWGISLATLTLSILAITVTFATVAILRESIRLNETEGTTSFV